MRWLFPVALLAGEYIFLTFLIDLSGRRFTSRGVDLLRLAVPIAIGTAFAGWLVARPGAARRDPRPDDAIPDWRPWPGIAGSRGVEIAQVVEDRGAPVKRYEPGHPHAEKDGYVLYPNINAMEEMVNVLSATRSYEANVQATNAAKEMALQTLEIVR